MANWKDILMQISPNRFYILYNMPVRYFIFITGNPLTHKQINLKRNHPHVAEITDLARFSRTIHKIFFHIQVALKYNIFMSYEYWVYVHI